MRQRLTFQTRTAGCWSRPDPQGFSRDRWWKLTDKDFGSKPWFHHGCSEVCNFAMRWSLTKNWICGPIYVTSSSRLCDRKFSPTRSTVPSCLTFAWQFRVSKNHQAQKSSTSSKSSTTTTCFFTTKMSQMIILTKRIRRISPEKSYFVVPDICLTYPLKSPFFDTLSGRDCTHEMRMFWVELLITASGHDLDSTLVRFLWVAVHWWHCLTLLVFHQILSGRFWNVRQLEGAATSW